MVCFSLAAEKRIALLFCLYLLRRFLSLVLARGLFACTIAQSVHTHTARSHPAIYSDCVSAPPFRKRRTTIELMVCASAQFSAVGLRRATLHFHQLAFEPKKCISTDPISLTTYFLVVTKLPQVTRALH